MNDEDGRLPYPAGILEILAGAFSMREEDSFDRLLLFPVTVLENSKWGFLIVTRKSPREDRLELAAYSYEIDPRGRISKKLESRKAKLPEDKLEEVIEGLVLRTNALDCDYREIDLSGSGNWKDQIEHLNKLLTGEPDEYRSHSAPGAGRDAGECLQQGNGTELGAGSGHGGSEPQHDV